MGHLVEPLLISIVLFGIVIAVLLVASTVSRYTGADPEAGHLVSLRFGFLGFVIKFVIVRVPPPGGPRDRLLGPPHRRVRIRASREGGRDHGRHDRRAARILVTTSPA